MRLKSSLRFALPLALLFGTTALSTSLLPPSMTDGLLSTAARADDGVGGSWDVGSWTSSDGTTYTVWVDDGTGAYSVSIEKGNTFTIVYSDKLADQLFALPGFKPGGDPGPDDTETGGEPPDIIGMLKNAQGAVIKVHVYPDQTPLAQWLDANGGGIVPVWNPGDDNGNGPPSPTSNKNTTGPTPKQLAAQAKLTALAVDEIDNIAGAMGDLDGLASENAPGVSGKGNQGNSAGAGNSNGKSSSSSSNGIRQIFHDSDDVSQGPHPELVNPPHYSVMTPGLLDGGNNALTGNGPAGTAGPGRGSAGAAGVGVR